MEIAGYDQFLRGAITTMSKLHARDTSDLTVDFHLEVTQWGCG